MTPALFALALAVGALGGAAIIIAVLIIGRPRSSGVSMTASRRASLEAATVLGDSRPS